MLVRDGVIGGADALEVCMLRRHLNSDFVGGAYVFPGGKVDDADRGSPAQAVCSGRTDEQASQLLGVEEGGLSYWIAALRECFEEAGVLLAYPEAESAASGGSDLVDAHDEGVRSRLLSLRHRLNAGEVGFVEGCMEEGLVLAADRVHYFSHWITPEPSPKRYDTRFFVAALPPGQLAVHDDYETIDTVWVRPAEALERARDRQFDIIFPTMKNLEAIARFETSASLLSAALAVERVPPILPKVVVDDRGFRILLPGDEGYEEAVSPRGPGPQTATDPEKVIAPADMNEIIRSIGADGRSRTA